MVLKKRTRPRLSVSSAAPSDSGDPELSSPRGGQRPSAAPPLGSGSPRRRPGSKRGDNWPVSALTERQRRAGTVNTPVFPFFCGGVQKALRAVGQHSGGRQPGSPTLSLLGPRALSSGCQAAGSSQPVHRPQ